MQNWLFKQAQVQPQKLALVYQDQKLTFEELAKQTEQTAFRLAAHGVGKQMRVAILAGNTLTSYLTILALQQLGSIPILLNYRLSFSEISTQLKLAKAKLFLIDESLQLTWYPASNLKVPNLSLADLLVGAGHRVELKPEFEMTDPASIMFTSGTTGQPHGVVQTFGNHFYSAVGSALNLGLVDHELWLCALPLFHISGLSIMMRSLVYGMGVYLLPHFSVTKVTQILQKESVTLMSVVPQILQQLLKVFPATGYNHKFRGFLLGGGPIDDQSLRRCRQLNLPVVQSYGMTETCSQVVALSFADATKHLGSVGKPLFPVQLRISPKDSQIQLKGPNIVTAYLDDAKSFAKKMTSDGWFETGDIGYLDQDGFLFVRGRQKEMIISGGENIFPKEIENVYQNYPGIREFALIGVPDKKWGQVFCAFFSADHEIDILQLKKYGQKLLAHYKVPRYFYQVSRLPRTSSRKISRYKLQQLYQQTKQILKSKNQQGN
jgi:O-succinylbenzoic acid--CoA ligase